MSEPTTFKEWLIAVDQLLMKEFSLTLSDLPDMLTRSAYDSGQSPEDFYANDVMELMREEFGPLVDER